MNTLLSEIMQEKLNSVPFETAVHRTCYKASLWKEEQFNADISSNEKLLIQQYNIFPGIEVCYNYFLADHFSHQHEHMPAIMEVNHCRHGRMGWQMKHELNLYLGEGELSFHMKNNCSKSSLSLPLGYYEGISFSIDIQKLQQNPPDILKAAKIDYDRIQTTFCDTTKVTAIPQSFDIECIFSGLYNLPEALVIPFCKLKTQEFILFLARHRSYDVSSLQTCDTEEVRIVKEIHTFLTTNLKERFTIEYLSKKYLLNTSTLKATFKTVYGSPVAAYMKEYRMNQAISYLRETDYSIADIAGLVGYENQSKFTAAFKSVVGVLPTTYRKNILGISLN